VAKKKVSPTDERAVAFRWLSNVIAEAEQELERLGLRRDSWQAIKIDLDALDRRSPRLVQVLEYRSETNDRTGRQTEWRGDDLTVLLNSRRRRDRARTQRAQAAAVRARAAHTALLLCEKFDSVMAALRREASANAARGKRDAQLAAWIVREGKKLVANGKNVDQTARALAAREDVCDEALVAQQKPYTASGIKRILENNGVRALKKTPSSFYMRS
jgi:hypothetical protein